MKYERAWRRAMRTRKPAIYRSSGVWLVARPGGFTNEGLLVKAWDWCEARA